MAPRTRRKMKKSVKEEGSGGRESPLPGLPYEMAVDVLSRVDAHALYPLRLVCKSWRSLIHDDAFISLHLSRSKSNPFFLVRISRTVFQYFREEENPVAKSIVLPLKTPFYPFRIDLLASYNGLLLLAKSLLGAIHDTFVFNPATGETVGLPLPRCAAQLVTQFFLNRETQEHKVLVISRPSMGNPPKLLRPCNTLTTRIFALGKKPSSWKETTYHGEFGDFQCGLLEPPLVQGAIHFINQLNSWPFRHNVSIEKILAFDVVKETLRTVASPPCCGNDCGKVWCGMCSLFLTENEGSLCMIHRVYQTSTFDMWVMKDYETWVKQRSIRCDEYLSDPASLQSNCIRLVDEEYPLFLDSYNCPPHVLAYHSKMGTLRAFTPAAIQKGDRWSGFYVDSLVRINNTHEKKKKKALLL